MHIILFNIDKMPILKMSVFSKNHWNQNGGFVHFCIVMYRKDSGNELVESNIQFGMVWMLKIWALID